MRLEDAIPLKSPIHIADIGASWLGGPPPYSSLLERKLARLSAFDGDDRQAKALIDRFGSSIDLYVEVIADGKAHTLYLAAPESGMSSILKPSSERLKFFNGFGFIGMVRQEVRVQSKKLDDIQGLAAIDYLKMDIQGAELMALKNGKRALRDCVAIQLEVSFVPLYERQPTFGEVDVYLRAAGFVPHCFVDVKKWSIAPTVRDGDFRAPFNQLLEADIVYIKDPLELATMKSDAIVKLAYIGWYCYRSPDLVAYFLLELERRGEAAIGSTQQLLAATQRAPARAASS